MTDGAVAFRNLVTGRSHGVWPALARVALRACSLPYALATRARNLAYDRHWLTSVHVNRPVICVGNLTVGGTGKTPCVEFIAKRLRHGGLRVAILSRGYGSTDGANDEALLLEDNLPDVPHLQSPDRVAIARIACEELDSQVLLLDDGFQHRRLHRDLEIVLLDATDPFGAGWQLPGGLLRESPVALRRADIVILTRCDSLETPARQRIRESVTALAGDRPWLEMCFLPASLLRIGHEQAPLELLAKKRVLAFCGIGNPAGFWKTLRDLDCELLDRRTFPDHHAYSREDVNVLAQWVRQLQPDGIVTTQKDLVKLRVDSIGGVPLLAVRIEARVESGIEHLDEALSRIAASALDGSR